MSITEDVLRDRLTPLSQLFRENIPQYEDGKLSLDGTVTGWETIIALMDSAPPLALRIYQGEGQERKAIKEYHAMRRLYQMDYPVPKVYYLNLDTTILGRSFIAMERLLGSSLSDAFDGGDDATKEHLAVLFVRNLARLHSIDVSEFLRGCPELTEYGEFSLSSTSASNSTEHTVGVINYLLGEVSQRGIKSLVTAFERFAEVMPSTSPNRLSVIHCDYHGRNLIYSTGQAVVLDWSQVRFGDGRYDLAWTLLLSGGPEGSEVADTLVKMYEENMGYPLKDMDFFHALAAGVRLAALAISLLGNPEELGMRPEAREAMLQGIHHYSGVYRQFVGLTGLRIAELEAVYPGLSESVS